MAWQVNKDDIKFIAAKIDPLKEYAGIAQSTVDHQEDRAVVTLEQSALLGIQTYLAVASRDHYDVKDNSISHMFRDVANGFVCKLSWAKRDVGLFLNET